MKIFWKLCLLSVLLLGCGGLVKRNPKVEFHYYHLTGEWDVRVPEARGDGGGLAIFPFDAASAIERRMLIRISETQIEYDDYEMWAEPPQEMATRAFAEGLEKSGVFARTASSDDLPADLFGRILTGKLERFEWDRSSEPATAYIEARLELRGANRGNYFWGERISAREPLAEETPAAYAEASRKALRRLIEQTAQKLSELPVRKK
ncbi:MAG TPA: ABC-type transport auxiliary lipoprotein family protein [Candidatus Sumerlaeota bacterium]|jgi:ABC-type uncharacterized transport system auxiliary subunit|nr:MAG: hypothetical protein BWY12_02486 [candidate division BRC1 bacterium ADurb.Bin183]HOE64579.1 ABC-type transport auxiliary lipoprotein family protein [Candidatus Sumerlaeota bacterium]HRR30010.1 ABC-type transport auxiliary lipoprotein family protein [Candidatus Sumerlaeia bacterium]HON49464.1 ABC-type transport auxiliary lipoprotein family protein [Candidatus Sumerlaeota bacterium]HOR64786.1 ABC-type transport auxiliary lipoprotein family protein [Candidatus Sumerlaeota bacterium]